jgi:UDP:flavonoid glycosyltransferase YjiC (YdhE family)
VTAESVGSEVRLLLDDPGYRERAQQLAREIEAMPGPADGVPLLEQLARDHRPVVRSAARR